MAKEYKINEPTDEIKAWHDRWAKNRAFADGEDAVKARGEAFLPKVRADDSPAEYEAHLARTSLYPATNKIEQGLSGLIFRKSAAFNASSAMVRLLAGLVSANGMSMDAQAAWVVRETMITNFTLLLDDHPDKTEFTGLTAANAIRKGFRPYVNGYAAETILEVTEGIVGAAVKTVHVRLLENEGTQVRQLVLDDDGFYEVRIHELREGDVFVHTKTYRPEIDGERLTEIPAYIVNTHGSKRPTPSMLQHCVDLNLQHYRTEGIRASILNLTQAPIIIVRGFEREVRNGEEQDPMWDVSPGAVWEIKSAETKVDYHIFKPEGYELVLSTLKDLKDALSTLGHSMIAPEKPAPEATAAHLLRSAAENATLASFTASVSGVLEKAYQQFARWADPKNSDLTFALNMDFQPAAMSAQEHKELRDDWQAGAIKHDTYLSALKDGEVLPATLDIDAEIEGVALEHVDRPTAEV